MNRIALILIVLLQSGLPADESQRAVAAAPGRVLFIGIDGCRFDAVEAAKAPNLDALRDGGCYSRHTLIQGSRYHGSDTVSGPGWSSLLTGVWADKHGVQNNRFAGRRYDRYPHFFHYLKSQQPQAVTVSIADWAPINEYIASDVDIGRVPEEDQRYVPGDRETADEAAEIIQRRDPTALFIYFGQVDEHGHKFGFHPSVPEYIAAIERVDEHVGALLTALRARPNFAAENWLVLVSSDHGGRERDHKDGHKVPEIMNSFFIAHGAAAAQGEIAGETFLVDVPFTALTHLGVRIDPAWQLDGRAIGLREK